MAPGSSSYLPPGPGIPPVTTKLVAAIVSGVFTDFACLLEAHAVADAPSYSFVADQLVIRPAKRRIKRDNRYSRDPQVRRSRFSDVSFLSATVDTRLWCQLIDFVIPSYLTSCYSV